MHGVWHQMLVTFVRSLSTIISITYHHMKALKLISVLLASFPGSSQFFNVALKKLGGAWERGYRIAGCKHPLKSTEVKLHTIT